MLHYDPAHRIRVAEIARHPWITQPVMNMTRLTEQIERNIEKNKKKSDSPNQKLRSMVNKGLLTKIKKYSNPAPKKKSSKQTNSLARSTQHLPLSSRHLFNDDDIDQSDMAMETSGREKFIR